MDIFLFKYSDFEGSSRTDILQNNFFGNFLIVLQPKRSTGSTKVEEFFSESVHENELRGKPSKTQ